MKSNFSKYVVVSCIYFASISVSYATLSFPPHGAAAAAAQTCYLESDGNRVTIKEITENRTKRAEVQIYLNLDDDTFAQFLREIPPGAPGISEEAYTQFTVAHADKLLRRSPKALSSASQQCGADTQPRCKTGDEQRQRDDEAAVKRQDQANLAETIQSALAAHSSDSGLPRPAQDGVHVVPIEEGGGGHHSEDVPFSVEIQSPDGRTHSYLAVLNRNCEKTPSAGGFMIQVQRKQCLHLFPHIARWRPHVEAIRPTEAQTQKATIAASKVNVAHQAAKSSWRGSLVTSSSNPYVNYYNHLSSQKDLQDPKAAIRNIFQDELEGAEDKDVYCANTLYHLLEAKSKRGVFSKAASKTVKNSSTTECIKALLAVCIDGMKNVRDFNKTLTQLNRIDGMSVDELGAYLSEHFPEQKNRVFGVDQAHWSQVGGHPFLSTPRYMDYERTATEPGHHTDNFVEAWGSAIDRGNRFVDITTLSPPEGAFLERLKQSIRHLHEKKQPITVRILFGSEGTWQTFSTRDILRKLTEGLQDSKLTIHVGTYSASTVERSKEEDTKKWASWNHSKIVAADEDWMVTGGTNLYEHYLRDENPVHDLSIQIPGRLAVTGHRFANNLWNYAWDQHQEYARRMQSDASAGVLKKVGQAVNPRNLKVVSQWGRIASFTPGSSEVGYASQPPERYAPQDEHASSTSRRPSGDGASETAIAIGRLANVGTNKDKVSDAAMIHMINRAQNSIMIAQQGVLDIVGLGETQFTTQVVNALVDALNRNVNTYILVSPAEKDFTGKGMASYASKWDRRQFIQRILKKMNDKFPTTSQQNLRKILDHLHINFTANGRNPVPNHSKVLIADGKTAYIGSHNLYDDSHAEFGVILGERKTQELISDYYAPFWHISATSPVAAGVDRRPPPASAYNPGDYVYIQTNPPARGRAVRDAGQEWHLAQILGKSGENEVYIVPNPMTSRPQAPIRVPLAQVRPAPEGHLTPDHSEDQGGARGGEDR